MLPFDKDASTTDISDFKTDESADKTAKARKPRTAKEDKPVELPIKDEDKDRFFDCIMTNKPYTEELEAMNGKFKVGFRTRTVAESEEVLKYINEQVKAANIDFFPDYQNKHLMCHLSYAVTSINGESATVTDLRDRVKYFQNLNAQVYMILCELFKRFDSKVEKLREEALKANF